MSYTSPSGLRPLVSKLDLDIRLGENLLVVGPSSAGKSALLRVLRGLWPVEEGEVNFAQDTTQLFPKFCYYFIFKIMSRNLERGCMFLPQRTRLLETGSLKDQVLNIYFFIFQFGKLNAK